MKSNHSCEANLFLFTLGNIFGFRTGAACAVYANRVRDEFEVKGELDVIKCGNEAVKILADMDKEKAGKKYWNASLRK